MRYILILNVIDFNAYHYHNRYMDKIIAITLLFSLIGCTQHQPLSIKNSNLTQGNVQMNLEVDKTTKNEVLEKFGSPNVTTRNSSGEEVWTYQRAAQVGQAQSEKGFFSVLLFGGSSMATGETSSKMITLIITFDSEDIVRDFKSRMSNF